MAFNMTLTPAQQDLVERTHRFAEEVIRLAEEKVASEDVVRDRLLEGMPVAEAFRTYGVL